jgi:hypothetical protein
MTDHSKAFKSCGTLIHQGEVELLSFDTALRGLDRHALVNFKSLRLEWFGQMTQAFSVLVEDQHFAGIAVRSGVI